MCAEEKAEKAGGGKEVSLLMVKVGTQGVWCAMALQSPGGYAG